VAEPEDLTALANNLALLVPMGLKVEASVVRDRFGFPDPPKGRDVELLTPPAPNQSPIEPVRTGHSRASCPHCAHAQGTAADSADLLTDQLEAEAQAAMDRLLEPVRRLVRGAHSLEEIQHGLLALYPDMEAAAFAQVFTQAMTAGAMAGRFEVGHGL
jgi:phage gp29-like protein